MKGLVPVIRREYLMRVKSKWFLMGTFLAPILMISAMIVPILFDASQDEARRSLAILDHTGVLFEGIRPRLEEAGFTVQEAPSDSEEALLEMVELEDLGGYLVLGPEALSRGLVVFKGREGPGTIRGLSIRGAVAQAALEFRLSDMGGEEDVLALLAGGELEVQRVAVEGAGATENDPEFLAAFVGAMLLYMVILLYAVAVMRATLEEKTGRIVEILISSIRPWELMLGKILGVGSVGLTQLAIWVFIGGLGMTMGLPALVASRPDMVDMEFVGQMLPSAGLTALFMALFFGGYFLYAALYAAVGAMCTTEEEAQQAQVPVVLLLVFPVMFMVPIIQNPNSTLAVVSSMVPFFTPILMYARVGSGVVPLWQILTSLVLLFGAVLAMAWVAGRIYRVGILMQGKRPNLPELWRWVRAA